MLENLRIALRKQRKLVLIFLLTIFLPALTLGVFGVRAIRSERFRLARQEEAEARRAAGLARAHLQSKLESMARLLEETARTPALIAKDIEAAHEILGKRLKDEPLAGQAILLYRDEPAQFPLMQKPLRKSPDASSGPNDPNLAERTRRAQALEFVERDFQGAASLYRELAVQVPGRDLQAEMLTGQARCLQKAGDPKGALRVNERIAGELAEAVTTPGLRLGLMARLRSVECRSLLGDSRGAVTSALEAYRKVLARPSSLTEEQFRTYASLVEEAFDALVAGEGASQVAEDLRKEYANARAVREAMTREWEGIALLENEVVPELARKLAFAGAPAPELFRFARTVGSEDILLMAAWIRTPGSQAAVGAVGVRLDAGLLSGSLLAEALAGAGPDDGAEAVLADLAGRPLDGQSRQQVASPLATEYFEGNFPPWRIEIFKGAGQKPGILDLRRNFYFWTILTLVIVLAFGAFLIARTIAHEMEILKIKSDFVSSVSHEFKTPLTSIRALTERLVDGKVRDPGKMDQYFAIIAQDTDRLTRLVNNLLDFSKIEEGKKEYLFAEADIVRIAAEQVESFKKERVQAGSDIRLEIRGEIPTMRADADALSRALANLIGNAVKFTPAGKAIRVGLRTDVANVIFEVEDEGIGIHADDLEKVFEKFFQGRNALDRSARGTGLGLTLVKHIVEAHGGRVLVESEVGRGSKFTVVLPIKT